MVGLKKRTKCKVAYNKLWLERGPGYRLVICGTLRLAIRATNGLPNYVSISRARMIYNHYYYKRYKVVDYDPSIIPAQDVVLNYYVTRNTDCG